MYTAIWAYEAQASDELSLSAGCTVEVFAKHEDGWWEGRLVSGQEGAFPSNYVTQPTHATEDRSTAQQVRKASLQLEADIQYIIQSSQPRPQSF